MARVIIDYHFAPIPLDAIGDPDLAPPVFELYCLLRKLGFQDREFTINELCQTLAKRDQPGEPPKPPARRSVYRWLTALETAGWLTWSRRGGDHDRFLPHNVKGVTPVSHVSPESHACDSTITLDVSPESHGDRPLPRPKAARERPKNPERIFQDMDGPIHPPTPQPAGDGWVDGSPAPAESSSSPEPTPAEETAALLRAINVRASTIPTLTHLPPAQVAAVIAVAQAKPGLRDVASWVVSTLRATRAPDPADAAALSRALAAQKEPSVGKPRPPAEPGPPAGLKIARARPARPDG